MLTDSYFLNIYLFVKTKLEIQKALAEDSTVYEYDSVYDEMQKKKEENTGYKASRVSSRHSGLCK